MSESIEDLYIATQIKRRMFIPEGAIFTTDGENVYKMVSANGDEREITVAPLALENGKVIEKSEERLYKYGEMVYLVEEDDGEEEE